MTTENSNDVEYTVLFRRTLEEEGEFEVCKKHLFTVESRVCIANVYPERQSVVIGRYSVLPYYQELENDVSLSVNARLINSHNEHKFIADAMSWGSEGGILSGLTPKTWSGEYYNLPEGSYIIKGKTNSRKNKWSTHMFAEAKSDIGKVVNRLMDDAFIADQGYVIREYVPLKKLGEPGIGGIPVTNEWRTFWIDTFDGPVMLAKGFYWASHPEVRSLAHIPDEIVSTLAAKAAKRIARYATFFVLDLAETESGDWIVIEVNDAQMSGLSCVDPEELYKNMAKYSTKVRLK